MNCSEQYCNGDWGKIHAGMAFPEVHLNTWCLLLVEEDTGCVSAAIHAES